MSNIQRRQSPDNLIADPVARPQHHIHNTNDPLPGAHGAAPANDYMEQAAEKIAHDGQQEKSISFADQSLGVQPTSDGSTTHTDSTQGKAGLGDKIVGKTQKVAGKIAKKPELLEKGELRETHGKSATGA